MYLKRIVLHGFKSFADRTEFEFGPGLTMVVGPNGCGKSNILDALRWVLGSQSAKSLRGAKMADVIFSGSRSRKPANAASVELTFDNRARFLATDDAEVTVGRVLYRSGESEYRVNGQTCRLKDIRHLFLDTGVGVDAYSVIEQGRVDMLLQANPLERREIFEEAAGISRYKAQRTEAQRKLERTQNNLLRLNDVMEELEKRLRSVKLAAAKARKFQEYDTRLRERRATFALAEYHELECRRRDLTARIDAAEERLRDDRAALATCDAEAAELDRDLHRFEEQLRESEAELSNLQSEQSALTERVSQGEQRSEDLAATRQRRAEQSAALGDRLAQLAEQVAAEETALAALTAEADAQSARVASLRNAHAEASQRSNESRAALERVRTQAFAAVRRAALLHSEQNNLSAEHERLISQQHRLTDRQAELADRQTELTAAAEQQRERLAGLERRHTELSHALHETEAQLKATRVAQEAQEREIAAAREARSAIRSRLELLEDMERRREGVDQAAQQVLGWRAAAAEDGPILGLVADLLQIDDERLHALQPVLATFEGQVVISDTHRFLTLHGERVKPLGRVQLLALDRLVSPAAWTTYDRAPGVLARAADLVQCDPAYRPLAEYLLGRVYLVDGLMRALAFAAEAPAGFTFVAVEGGVVHSDGRLVIGGPAQQAGLISRRAEIRHLQEEMAEVEHRLQQAQRAHAEHERQAADLELQRRSLLDELATQQRAEVEARTALNRLDDELARLQREAQVLESERRAAERSLAEVTEKLQRIAAESSAAGEAQQAHEAEMAALQRELETQEAALAQVAQELTEARVAAGRSGEKRAAAEGALQQFQQRRAALLREQEQAQREAETLAAQFESLARDLATARQRIAAGQAEIFRCQQTALERRAGRQAARLRLEECGAAARGLHERIRAAEASLHESQVAQREIDVRQESLRTRVQEDLVLDLAAQYATYEHTDQDWEAIKTEIAELREKINRLGHVNLDAIAELEELSPRHEHLTQQRADLTSSVERLETLIRQLDDESRMRFAESFTQIRGHFQELFRKLFGGGKADIILEDPERPLECGIEIVARPPGKEPQSISLLSGGERTMTAVALVMAVFRSKPSPFAFLDEVDAALDEANTERFNTLLQEFLSHSQFVVITHSKRTMQAADVLYGITMEEPGVSKRVSVRFEDRVQAPIVA